MSFAPRAVTILDYLGQRTFWRSGNGTVSEIGEMALPHKERLLQWLYNNAEALHGLALLDFGVSYPQGDEAQAAHDREWIALAEMDPGDWMSGRPFTKELSRRLDLAHQTEEA